ncbi:MAG: BBE domain-containing protein [Thermomicrobiales bacterium]
MVDWVRRFQAEVAPFGLGQGFLNFNSVESADLNAVIRQSFGANWDRLVAIKRQIDPNNMFRGNHNILPN